MPRGLTLAALILALFSSPALSQSNDLASDVAERFIEITSSFTGAKVTIFGSSRQDMIKSDLDVVIVVRGPSADATVRRKDRVLGIWINRKSVTFSDVPQFYGVAATRSFDAIATDSRLARAEIRAKNVAMFPRIDPGKALMSEPELAPFREAFVRRSTQRELYKELPGAVQIVGSNLFRTEFNLPATVPVGTYTVTVHLFDNGSLITRQTSSFQIKKTGIEARIYNLAHQQPLIYGIVAVALALFFGWAAAAIFRRA